MTPVSLGKLLKPIFLVPLSVFPTGHSNTSEQTRSQLWDDPEGRESKSAASKFHRFITYSALNMSPSWDHTTRVCVPTGASPDSHPVCRGGRAALLQRGMRGSVHTGSGPRLPRHDRGRASNAAVPLPGGGAADGEPDGSAHPQGQPIWDTGYFIPSLGSALSLYANNTCPWGQLFCYPTCAELSFGFKKQSLNWCRSFFYV